MEEREVPLSALTATAQNIAEEFPNLEEERESPGVMDEVRTYLCSLVFLKISMSKIGERCECRNESYKRVFLALTLNQPLTHQCAQSPP